MKRLKDKPKDMIYKFSSHHLSPPFLRLVAVQVINIALSTLVDGTRANRKAQAQLD